jgi:hypothetical protein
MKLFYQYYLKVQSGAHLTVLREGRYVLHPCALFATSVVTARQGCPTVTPSPGEAQLHAGLTWLHAQRRESALGAGLQVEAGNEVQLSAWPSPEGQMARRVVVQGVAAIWLARGHKLAWALAEALGVQQEYVLQLERREGHTLAEALAETTGLQ